MTKSLATATQAEVVNDWALVDIHDVSGTTFNRECIWLGERRLQVGVDFVFSPGEVSNKGTDQFRFKDKNMAVLFKLTFGGE